MRIYLLLESYYQQTRPIYCGTDESAAFRFAEARARSTESVRRRDLEDVNRIGFWSNNAAYTYDLYCLPTGGEIK